MRQTLDPKLDVVFKLLFADPRNTDLLRSLLTAVLRPPLPITTVTVLNPEPPTEDVGDKHVVLDIRAQLEDGRQLDVEMQSQSRPAQRERALYYWARMYVSQGTPGLQYHQLEPCVVVFITNYRELASERYHSMFHVREKHDHSLLSEALELHLVELPKLPDGDGESEEEKLEAWGKFLRAPSDEELEKLAMSDPELRQAKEALDRLSADPVARELAQRRERDLVAYQMDMGAAREEGLREGIEKGIEKGIEEGRKEGCTAAILALCEVFEIEISPARHERLQAAELPELERLLSTLRCKRQWPDE